MKRRVVDLCKKVVPRKSLGLFPCKLAWALGWPIDTVGRAGTDFRFSASRDKRDRSATTCRSSREANRRAPRVSAHIFVVKHSNRCPLVPVQREMEGKRFPLV